MSLELLNPAELELLRRARHVGLHCTTIDPSSVGWPEAKAAMLMITLHKDPELKRGAKLFVVRVEWPVSAWYVAFGHESDKVDELLNQAVEKELS